MTSPAPLTEAEEIAAKAILRHFGQTESCEDCALLVHDLVAAVRGSIEADALEQAANAIDEDARKRRADVMSGQSTESFEFIEGIEHASGLVEARIQSLSLPASKETQK